MSNRPCGSRKLKRRERMEPDVIQPNEIRTRLVLSTLWRHTSVEKREKKLTHSDVFPGKNGNPCDALPGNSLFRDLPVDEHRIFTPMNINVIDARSLKARKTYRRDIHIGPNSFFSDIHREVSRKKKSSYFTWKISSEKDSVIYNFEM